jgi:hypothetical protein
MELPLYKVARLSADHALDGRIDKDDWKAADSAQLVDAVTGHEPHQKTTAKFGWTDSHIWAAFHCEDTAITANLTEHDHRELWTENVVEVFLDPLRHRHIYYELQVNCRNTSFDGIIHLASGAEGVGARGGMQCFTDWNPETFQHVVTGKGKFNKSADSDEYWDVELSIAFSDLYMIGQAPPKPGEQWLFNSFRVDSGPWGQELYAWSPTMMPNFHVSARFGTMEFLGG